MSLFKYVLEGMIDNNKNHDAEFSDWQDAAHAIETCGDGFTGDCEAEEMDATVDALNTIIESNGEKLNEAVTAWNLAVWGKNFVDNNGPTPFGG